MDRNCTIPEIGFLLAVTWITDSARILPSNYEQTASKLSFLRHTKLFKKFSKITLKLIPAVQLFVFSIYLVLSAVQNNVGC